MQFLSKWTNLGEANEIGKVPLIAYLNSLYRARHMFWVCLPDEYILAEEPYVSCPWVDLGIWFKLC